MSLTYVWWNRNRPHRHTRKTYQIQIQCSSDEQVVVQLVRMVNNTVRNVLILTPRSADGPQVELIGIRSFRCQRSFGSLISHKVSNLIDDFPIGSSVAWMGWDGLQSTAHSRSATRRISSHRCQWSTEDATDTTFSIDLSYTIQRASIFLGRALTVDLLKNNGSDGWCKAKKKGDRGSKLRKVTVPVIGPWSAPWAQPQGLLVAH